MIAVPFHLPVTKYPSEKSRPSVLGRKNYLFRQNDSGAEDNAIFYTFMVSCEILGINPYRWLKHTFEHIRPDMEEPDLILH